MHLNKERWMVVAGSVITYFVVFPGDLEAVAAPVREVLRLVEDAFQMTQSISPWAYGLAAVGILAWALIRCFGKTGSVVAQRER